MLVTSVRVVMIALCVMLALATPARAGAPTESLRSYIDQLFTLLDDPTLKGTSRTAARQRELRAVLEDAVDFQEAARRSLGEHWETRTPEDRSHFVRLFTDLIDQVFVGRLSHEGEKIAYDEETLIGQAATVRAHAVSKGGDITPVAFFLRQDDDTKWRIYDVGFAGMSLVGMYRAQFAKVIRATSYEGLIIRLEEKTRFNGQASVKGTDAATKNAP